MIVTESAPLFNPNNRHNRHNRDRKPPASDLRRVYRRDVPCADLGAPLEVCASYRDEHGSRETLYIQGNDPSALARLAHAAERDRQIPAGRIVASDFETGRAERQIAVRA